MASVKVNIIGDASGLNKAYRQASTSTQAFGKETQTMTGHVNRLRTSILAMSGVLLGAGGLTVGLKSVVDAARNAEEAQGRLSVTMKDAGLSYAGAQGQITSFLQKQSELSAFMQVPLTDAFNNLVRQTKNVGEAMKDTALASDIARGRHVSLEAATQIVIKANMGLTGALKRMGIEITPVKDAQNALIESGLKFTAQQKDQAKALDQHATALKAVAALTETYTGQAAKYGDSSAGAMDKFKVAVNNLEISVGKVLLPTINKALTGFTDWINRMNDSGKAAKYAQETVDLIKASVQAIKPFVEAAASAFQKFSDAVGGTKRAIELLLVAFATFKVAGIVGSLATMAGSATAATGAVGGLRLALLSLGNPYVIAALAAAAAGLAGFKLGDVLGNKLFGAGTQVSPAMAAGSAANPGQWVNQQGKIIPTLGPTAPSSTAGSGTGAAKRYIQSMAASFGLDPAAVIGVANNESGGWSGKAGDHGTSFGPFQLHVGGALPQSIASKGAAYANAWAWSPAGIDYALNAMAAAGARGLTGAAAVSAIVNNFERPANTTADISAGNAAVSGTSLADILAHPRATPAKPLTAKQKKAAADAARKAAADAAKARIDLQQQLISGNLFAALGLGTTGGAAVPTLGSLQNRLGELEQAGRGMGLTAQFKKLGHAMSIAVTNGASPEVRTAFSGMLDTVATTIQGKMTAQKTKWQAHLKQLQTAVAASKAGFESAFGSLASAALAAFDKQTAAAISGLEANRKELTPAEQQLQDIQQAHDDAAMQAQLAADQAAGDTKAVAEDIYQIQVKALSKQADAERAAKDQQFADQEQAFQDQRDLARTQFEQQLQDLQTQLETKHMTISNANSAILDLMSKFGLDPTWFTAGANAASSLIAGLGASLKAADSQLAHLNDVQQQMTAFQNQAPGLPTSGAPNAAQVAKNTYDYPFMASGGRILASGLAYLHQGETVVPAGRRGGMTVNVTVNGDVTGQELIEKVRIGLIRDGRRNGTALGAYA